MRKTQKPSHFTANNNLFIDTNFAVFADLRLATAYNVNRNVFRVLLMTNNKEYLLFEHK